MTIPEAAEEAALKAHRETPSVRSPDTPQRLMRAALEAALPAIREQIEAEISNYWDAVGELIDSHNGVRFAVDAVVTHIREGDA